MHDKGRKVGKGDIVSIQPGLPHSSLGANFKNSVIVLMPLIPLVFVAANHRV
jgi:hypothetical protein